MTDRSPLPATSLAVRAWTRAAAGTTAAFVGMAAFTLAAVGFLVAALFLWLLPALGAPAAAALTGVLLLAVAALIFAFYQAWRARHRPPDPAAALAQDILTAIRARPLDAVLLALSAGIGAGARR